jgi:hypothetical protein
MTGWHDGLAGTNSDQPFGIMGSRQPSISAAQHLGSPASRQPGISAAQHLGSPAL